MLLSATLFFALGVSHISTDGLGLASRVISAVTFVPTQGASEQNPAPSEPVMVPTRGYYAPGQPITVRVNHTGPVDLVMRDFIGRSSSSRAVNIQPGEVDLNIHFANAFREGNTYTLLAMEPGADATRFIGTPLVVSVRRDERRGAPAGPLVFRVLPLEYARLSTTAGDMSVCFYYDSAPNTVDTVQRLMREGFYSGLDFFRVEPGFIVQTGDPRSDGTGGPGFQIDAEFSDRQHLEGVLSMARLSDPNEAPGLIPRPEFANSAGSQFFICLSYEATRQLDRRYSTFARVVDGLDTLRAIASAPNRDNSSRPQNPVKITSARLVPVTREDNPYARLQVVLVSSSSAGEAGAATTQPVPPSDFPPDASTVSPPLSPSTSPAPGNR